LALVGTFYQLHPIIFTLVVRARWSCMTNQLQDSIQSSPSEVSFTSSWMFSKSSIIVSVGMQSSSAFAQPKEKALGSGRSSLLWATVFGAVILVIWIVTICMNFMDKMKLWDKYIGQLTSHPIFHINDDLAFSRRLMVMRKHKIGDGWCVPSIEEIVSASCAI
jgi:hypothetical protein